MDLMVIDGVQTMDSRDIAEITGKRHDNVFLDIEVQFYRLGEGVLRFQDTYIHPQNGQRYKCYKLPYRETLILVSGYSVELRARVIDRWIELEREASGKIPKTYAEALQLAADQAKEIEAKTAALALAAPKVESFDALQKSDNSMSITQAAKHFAVNPKTMVFPYLRAHNYLTIKDLPSQSALDAGYMVMRETRCPDGTFRPQARVLDCQLETWRTKVIPQISRWIADV